MFTLNPCAPTFLETLDFLLKLAGAISAVVIFFVGLRQYNKGQVWKKNEFLANAIKDFNDDEMVQNAMTILDWDAREIELFPYKENPDERYVLVNRSILTNALRYGVSEEGKSIKFDPTEKAIRDTFSVFFDYFEKYQAWIDSKLIHGKDLEPYVLYWIESMSANPDKPYVKAIHEFIIRYKFIGTIFLFDELGHRIPGTDHFFN